MTGGKAACRQRKNAVFQTCASAKVVVSLFSLLIPLGFWGYAQDAAPSEYQIKAAFLFNFAKFVEWPTQAFANPQSPIVIGVLGKNVFGDDLERTIRDKKINSHPFEFKQCHALEEATNCQILFISASEKERLPEILDGLHGKSVLTVSETDGFIKAGGMINFVIENNRVHFQINDEAAKQAGLKISSKLLSLATRSH